MSGLTNGQQVMLDTFQGHVTGRRYREAIDVGERLLAAGIPVNTEVHYRVLNNLGIAYDCAGDEVNVYMEGGEVRFRSLDRLRMAVEVANAINRPELAARTSDLIRRLPNSYFENLFQALD